MFWIATHGLHERDISRPNSIFKFYVDSPAFKFMEIWEGIHMRYNAQNGQRYRHHHSRNQSFSSALLDAICRSTEEVEGTTAHKKSDNRQATREVPAEDKTLIRNSNHKSFSRVERQWDDDDYPAWTNNEKLMRGRSVKVGGFNAEKYEAEAANIKNKTECHPSFQSTLSSAAPCSSDYTSDSTSNCPDLSSNVESLYTHTSSVPTAKTEKNSSHVGREARACKWATGGERSRDLHGKSSVRDGSCRSSEKHSTPTDHRAKNKSKSRNCKDSKKPKHPISPGSKLVSFLNSLFLGGSTKKPKLSSSCSVSDSNSYHSCERKPSTCSSSSSTQSRPCLSKTSRRSKNIDGARKCVTFYPTSVIVDENSRQCGEKCLQGMQNPSTHPNPSDYQEIKHPSVDAHELPLLSKKLKHQGLDKDSGHVVPTARNAIAKHQKTNSIVEVAVIRDLDKEDEYGEKDDNGSCSSSDLFELECW